jgi:hypothetical protein
MDKPLEERQGCLTVILALFGIRLAKPVSEGDLPYRQRDDFLSAAELSFYRVLKQAVGDRAMILCKVNLADVFFVARPNENRAYLNKIDRKHIDFLLCEPNTMRPRVGIELDDASHGRQDRQQRDDFVNTVFNTAGLPLLRIPTKTGYIPQDILAKVVPHLQTEDNQPVVAQLSEDGPPTCPKCGVSMVLRTATKGAMVGQQFYGCPNYPRCREIVRR